MRAASKAATLQPILVQTPPIPEIPQANHLQPKADPTPRSAGPGLGQWLWSAGFQHDWRSRATCGRAAAEYGGVLSGGQKILVEGRG